MDESVRRSREGRRREALRREALRRAMLGQPVPSHGFAETETRAVSLPSHEAAPGVASPRLAALAGPLQRTSREGTWACRPLSRCVPT